VISPARYLKFEALIERLSANASISFIQVDSAAVSSS
jgi:hypothetical protein